MTNAAGATLAVVKIRRVVVGIIREAKRSALSEHLSITPVNSALSNMSAARQALLQKYLRGDLKQQAASPRLISARSNDEPALLSFSQERLWFLDQLLPGSAVFNVPLTARLTGAIDPIVLERSINEVVRRH